MILQKIILLQYIVNNLLYSLSLIITIIIIIHLLSWDGLNEHFPALQLAQATSRKFSCPRPRLTKEALAFKVPASPEFCERNLVSRKSCREKTYTRLYFRSIVIFPVHFIILQFYALHSPNSQVLILPSTFSSTTMNQ